MTLLLQNADNTETDAVSNEVSDRSTKVTKVTKDRVSKKFVKQLKEHILYFNNTYITILVPCDIDRFIIFACFCDYEDLTDMIIFSMIYIERLSVENFVDLKIQTKTFELIEGIDPMLWLMCVVSLKYHCDKPINVRSLCSEFNVVYSDYLKFESIVLEKLGWKLHIWEHTYTNYKNYTTITAPTKD